MSATTEEAPRDTFQQPEPVIASPHRRTHVTWAWLVGWLVRRGRGGKGAIGFDIGLVRTGFPTLEVTLP